MKRKLGSRRGAPAALTFLALVLLVGGSVTGPAAATGSHGGSKKKDAPVIMFAADGMRPDLMQKYAATGGWGFGRFVDGKPADEAQHHTCFACHQARVKNHDFVFTRWAP